MADPIKVIVLDGDQTGQELVQQSIRVLDSSLLGIDIELEHFDLSLGNRRATSNMVLDEAATSMQAQASG
jgi:isocitrate/isopropylmalate dehydrogenase